MASDPHTQQEAHRLSPIAAKLGPGELPETRNELILFPERGDPLPAALEVAVDAADEGTGELDRILRENRRYRLAVTRRSRRRRTTPGSPRQSTR